MVSLIEVEYGTLTLSQCWGKKNKYYVTFSDMIANFRCLKGHCLESCKLSFSIGEKIEDMALSIQRANSHSTKLLQRDPEGRWKERRNWLQRTCIFWGQLFPLLKTMRFFPSPVSTWYCVIITVHRKWKWKLSIQRFIPQVHFLFYECSAIRNMRPSLRKKLLLGDGNAFFVQKISALQLKDLR